MTLPLPRLPGHGLSAPTGDEFRAALRRVTREDVEDLWTQVCLEAGVARGAYLLELDQADALAAAMSALPAPYALAGQAMAVRVASYRALAPAAEGQGRITSTDWGRVSIQKLLASRLPAPERLAEIADLDLFTPEAREKLDRAAKRVAERFGTPMGLVSIVLEGAQQFAGSHGLSGWIEQAGGTPVEWSFCATTVRTQEPYVVPDATADSLQRSNPLVTQDGLGMYAGVPLISSRGHVLGAYCVLGDAARSFSDEEMIEFRGMADAVVAELERHRLSDRAAPAGEQDVEHAPPSP